MKTLQWTQPLVYRSSHQVCSVRKGALRNFPKFAGKHLRPATLLKRRLWHRCFSVNFAKIFKNAFLQKTFDGCFFLRKNDGTRLEVGDSLIESRTFEKLLGVKIDNKLSFEEHFKSICKKANNILITLVSSTPYMEIGKRKLLLTAFVNAQVSYCPPQVDATQQLQ